MTRYMLDTNAVSDLVKGHPDIARRLVAVPMSSICISAITEEELLYGLDKWPEFSRLRLAVEEFLLRTDVLPWDSTVTPSYGYLRASLEGQGKVLGFVSKNCGPVVARGVCQVHDIARVLWL